jgi:hypothetical protein
LNVIYLLDYKILEKAMPMGKSIKIALTKNRVLKEDNFLVIRESATGLGVFANRYISANSYILTIQGSPLHFDATTRLGDKESYCLQTESDGYIFLEAPFCFFNHSCEPNCGIREGSSLYTVRPINRGEELSWDYSTSMLERHWTLNCCCRSSQCRSAIRDFDFLPQSVQDRYLAMGIVMPFIERELRTSEARDIIFLSRTGT